MPFHHENLDVYQQTLSFNAKVGVWTSQWDGKHAIRDQLARAAESMLENIAMASAAYSAMKVRGLDYALGSSLECAACLNIAGIKRLLDEGTVSAGKVDLSQIFRMLVGLRKAWSSRVMTVREDEVEYNAEQCGIDKGCDKGDDKGGKMGMGGTILFHHEGLDVYRIALEVTAGFCGSEAVGLLSSTVFRRLDELVTSVVLNIAEGNGRFSDADQVRFLGTAHESAVKLAARLDLCVIQDLLPQSEVARWKTLLQRVSAMTVAMVAGMDG